MDAGTLTEYKRYRLLFGCLDECQSTSNAPGTNPPDAVIASVYSNITQTISSYSAPTNNTPAIFTYDHTPILRGVTMVGNTGLRVSKTGYYETYYSIQIHNSKGGSTTNVYIWIRVNGVDVPDTNGRVQVNSNNGDSLPIVPYILKLNANDYVEFAAWANDTDVQALALYGPSTISITSPSVPSIIVGLKEISAYP